MLVCVQGNQLWWLFLLYCNTLCFLDCVSFGAADYAVAQLEWEFFGMQRAAYLPDACFTTLLCPAKELFLAKERMNE